MRPAVIILLLIILIGALSAAVGYQVDSVNWRLKVIALKATGGLEGATWDELLTMLKPGSGIYLAELAETPNVFAVVRNPYSSAEDIERGKQAFDADCVRCHGADGLGGTAPNIASQPLSRGDSDWAIYKALKNGIPGTAMVSANLSDAERWQVTGYVLDLRERDLDRAEESEELPPKVSVPYERILRADAEPQNWLTYSRRYDGQRHTTLTGISKASLDRLGLRWVMQTDVTDVIEASPIVVDGVMFLSLPGGSVLAVDAATGDQYWRFDTVIESDLPICCGVVNRGVAILNDRIFATTLDNRLQSLDASTGELVWEKTVADGRDGYTITVAPLAIKDKIIVGVSGGEYGIRGFLDAYDSVTGERVWRFHTIPGPGVPGNDTWSGESWRTGGGPTWVTGSFDPALNLLIWGVGNPSPDFDGSQRMGDNLYTNSAVALDADTGELRWHFQFTPHDFHDFDANQVPVLVDQLVDGQLRKFVFWGNRNGFFYALDRVTGKYLGSVTFAKQTWALEIDAAGRPVKNPEAVPSPQGTLVWPGGSGAANWPPPSFNPATGLVYIPASNRPSIFFNSDVFEPRELGQVWMGSTSAALGRNAELLVVAIDPLQQSIVWQQRLDSSPTTLRFSGIVSTRELAFVGGAEKIIALDATSGEALWSSDLGGVVGSPPVTYAVDGVQYLTISAGPNIFTFGVDVVGD